MGRRPKFDSEFRAHAVEMVRSSGRPRYQVAKDLGVSDTTLAKWMAKDKSNDDTEPLSVSEREDYERLLRAERECDSPWVFWRLVYLDSSSCCWVCCVCQAAS
jgi:transposase